MNQERVAELIRVRPSTQVSIRIDLLVLEQVGAQATFKAWDQVWDGVRWPIWRETKAQVCHRVAGQAQEALR